MYEPVHADAVIKEARSTADYQFRIRLVRETKPGSEVAVRWMLSNWQRLSGIHHTIRWVAPGLRIEIVRNHKSRVVSRQALRSTRDLRVRSQQTDPGIGKVSELVAERTVILPA